MKENFVRKLKIVSKGTETKRQKLERELLPKDRDLRSKLEEEFVDDKRFEELVNEILVHLQKLYSGLEGIDKARILAPFYALVKQLKLTERSRLSQEFIRLGEEIRKSIPKTTFRKQPEAKDKIA